MAEAKPRAAVFLSSTVTGMYGSNVAAPDIEPILDFELQQNTVKGYVADYFKYRLSLNGHSWPDCPEIPIENESNYRVMHAVVAAFEEKHGAQLSAMIDAICSSKHLSFQRYVGVVENFGLNSSEGPAQMSYGRLIALLAFGGMLVAHLADTDVRQDITPVALYTSKFIEKRILSTWAQDERSWEKFFQLGETIVRNRTRFADRWLMKYWPLIGVIGVTTIGTILICRKLLRR